MDMDGIIRVNPDFDPGEGVQRLLASLQELYTQRAALAQTIAIQEATLAACRRMQEEGRP